MIIYYHPQECNIITWTHENGGLVVKYTYDFSKGLLTYSVQDIVYQSIPLRGLNLSELEFYDGPSTGNSDINPICLPPMPAGVKEHIIANSCNSSLMKEKKEEFSQLELDEIDELIESLSSALKAAKKRRKSIKK